LPKTDLNGAKEIANKLRLKVSEREFKGLDKNITCSFGVTAFRENDTQDTLILRADEGMYEAKRNGRNRVEVL